VQTEDITLTDTAALRPGSIVAGKFLITRFVGAGGMAQVFEAVNRDIDERVALKVMHPMFRADADMAAKFREEARSAARIRSECVARVFDVVSTDDGDPVIVMEFLDGVDLRTWIDTHPRPSLDVVAAWTIAACAGLAAAHANGIVHRDVKPENLFVAQEIGGRQQLKLLDFGISRIALTHNPDRPGSGQHRALKLIGTPTYMAPEQITSSRAADPRMDVWSVGVLLYELFAGRAPFRGATPEETCLAILDGVRPDLRALRPDLPDDVTQLVDRCLSKAPNGRPPSVADVAVALHPFARTEDWSSVDRAVTLLRSAGLTQAATPQERLSSNPSPRLISTPLPPSAHGDDAALGAPASVGDATEASRDGAPTTRGPAGSAPSSPAQPVPRSRVTTMAAVAIALIAACVGAFFVWRGSDRSAATVAGPAPSSVARAFATVALDSRPQGALVEIDGASRGTTPHVARLELGRHELRLRHPGYVDLVQVLDVSPEMDGDSLSLPLESALVEPGNSAVASGEPDVEPEPSSEPKKGRSAARPPVGADPREPIPASTPGTASPSSKVELLPDGPSKVRVIQ